MKKHLIVFIITCCSLTVIAQYNGGKGDGLDYATVVQSNLNGIIGGIMPLYQGGAGDGFDKNRVSAYLNGTNTTILYNGGRGDGFVNSAGSFSMNGADLANLYTGGNGDGFDKKKFSGFLNNTGAIVLYNGGSGDGFDKKTFSGVMNGTSTEIFYRGGDGDGFSNAQVQAFVSGLSLDAIYNGGDGDGFAKAEFSGTLIALPIALLSFDATAREKYVLVKWVTASEEDNDFFTVERSRNGMLFDKLVILPGQGNSRKVQVYTVNDNDPLQGRSFYRLKWTDMDGQSAYSDIRSVLFNQKIAKDFLLFPNPNDGNIVYVQLNGLLPNETISISLADMQGKIIYQSQNPAITGSRIAMTLSQKLAKGSYVVRVIRNGESSAKVLIVR